MRYPASEKAEIIRLVEQSHLPVRRTLEKLGIPRATFYRWYDLHRTGGPEAHFIVAWKLCATMRATDVTETLDLALAASGLDQVTIVHRPRLLTDNGASYMRSPMPSWEPSL